MIAAGLRPYLEGMVRLRATMQRPEGFHYNGIEDFVLQHGREFPPVGLTADERRYVVAVAKACPLHFRIKQCFSNSQEMLVWDRERRLEYVEGYCRHLIPFLHGWLAIDGKVIDLTLRPYRKSGTAITKPHLGAGILGTWPDSRAYFGVQFPRETVREFMLETLQSGTLLDDYQRGYPLLQKPWRQAP